MNKKIQVLDCTLRDGGYYTNWDFEDSLVDAYLKSMNSLVVDFIEIGYRSPKKPEYLGKYFYCPKSVMEEIKSKTTKKLAIILNEKDVPAENAEELLQDCSRLIDLIRIAVAPENLNRAIEVSRKIKEMGFDVAFNVMYMSNWSKIDGFFDQIETLNGTIDYFYLVDSYGGVLPSEVEEMILKVKARLDCKIGFHGHNNLELGLINTLTALDAGVDIVDATVTGMGRGAGNLKTELLLTTMNARYGWDVNFNALGTVVDSFEHLQSQHKWGTNLPYMVSGANSLPQKDVMDWVGKRFYSMNSIVQTLHNQSIGVEDNIKLETFLPEEGYDKILLIGGGPSVSKHAEALRKWCESQDNLAIVHASSKNSIFFKGMSIQQYFCLVGNEGHRLESNAAEGFEFVSECVLPPFPRKMGTYIPSGLREKCFELKTINFTNKVNDSHTVLALQTALELKAAEVFVTGYDGYFGDSVKQVEIELSHENEQLFDDFKNIGVKIVSLTPTRYEILDEDSVYSNI
ncbi:hypothetical protein BFP97_08975 [Roseivirga sp. 4D4]|nr:hypothetical protein BFP97_08975 [Roseivirga sp. 4D4]